MLRPSGRVLVVDDEPEIADLLAEAIRDEGLTAVVAYDGLGALARFEQEDFDVVVSDVRMPGCGGIELLEQLKLRTPAPSVILISGFTDMASDETIRAGGTVVFSKPFNFDHLIAEVRRCLLDLPRALRES